jgi:hypothetical protein
MGNKLQTKESIEKEMNCCALCVCVIAPPTKGTKYCSNTSKKNYEEVKTPSDYVCKKFIPKVKT